MADLLVSALVRAWQTTMLAMLLLVAALTLFRMCDSVVLSRELPSSFQPADYSIPCTAI